MGYLLEALGRGLLAELLAAFENQLPGFQEDEPDELRARQASSPTSVDLALRLGMSCLRSRRLSEALRVFQNALELGPPSAQPALGLACVYDELGQLDQALRYLSIAQAHDPQDPAIAFAMGVCHERREEVDAATVNYRRALELCPHLRNACERLAAIALHQGDLEAAIVYYERLAEFEPGDVDVLLSLANLLLLTGRPREASDHYQQALVIEPDLAEEALPETEGLDADNRLAEAIKTLESLVCKYPNMAPFHIHLGDLYAKSGADRAAIEQYRAALDAQPDLLEATVKLGTQHLRLERYADAAQTFNRAVELNDRLMLGFVGLGVSQHTAGNQHEALATLDLAASLEPSTTLLFAETARLHLRAERAEQADLRGQSGMYADDDEEEEPDHQELLEEVLRRHRRALLASPNHADLHYRYGLLLRQVGEYEEAIQAFRHAVELNPCYAKALIKLGILLKETGEVEEAIAVFRQALALDNRYVDVHYQLGLLFAQRNRFELAVEEFEQAVAGNERNVAFRANLALALQNIGMLDRAAASWRAICELSRTGDSVLERRQQFLREVNRE
jgi:tetratricopeptide (TPR) repeat protein